MQTRLPLFFEAWESQTQAELQVCHKIMRILFRNKIAPLPFASTLDEMAQVTTNLCTRGSPPVIFIVNTYWAEELLLKLDEFMSDLPVLFLRRSLSHDARVKNLCGDVPGYAGLTAVLGGMRPRLASVWGYGGKNADDVAELAATCLMRYLADGEFRHIEAQTRYSVSNLNMTK